MASQPRDSSICAILLDTLASHRSVCTGWPESACSVTGVMKRQAAAVITTRTSAPACVSKRVNSAAL